ncbi:PadR family transcriptional regulator [Amycolatopsis taiwanensis]|uniref:PadR family transcriptional regulator n=1 Tax=Amycolatopsis taiwanensis TaxID=342230 RepID=A0A9W6VJY1_9PSEU|nr:PadR family transcriptional regulator [Amycolatopsis taiwanensis]GLY69907.1 PadR family transcriptional regulator [Amycolatopsis taiwanensis]
MNADAIRGHLDSLVLAVLEQRPLHGYGIIEAMRLRSDGTLEVPSGTLYPALHRLERAKLISSNWDDSTGRRRRTYTLTAIGRRRLREERAGWKQFAGAVTAILGEAPL